MSSLTPPELRVKNPEFTYRNNDCMALELEVQISHPGEKTGADAVLTFYTGDISGYEMDVMVADGTGKWSPIVGAEGVSIRINGEYERSILVAALQKIGLLTKSVYGTISASPFEYVEKE